MKNWNNTTMFKLASLFTLLLWHSVISAASFVRVDVAIDNMPSSSKMVQALCRLSDSSAETNQLPLEGMANAVIRNGRFHGTIDVPFSVQPLAKFDQVQCELRLCATLQSDTVCEQPIASSAAGFNSYSGNAFHQLSATEQIDLNPPPSSDGSAIIGFSSNRASGYIAPDRGLANLADSNTPSGTATRHDYGVIPAGITADRGSFVSLERAIAASYVNRGLATNTTTYLAINDTLPTELLLPRLTELKLISTPSQSHWRRVDIACRTYCDPLVYEEFFIVNETLIFEVSIETPAPANGLTLAFSSTTSFIDFQAGTIHIPEGATSTRFRTTTAITQRGSTGWSVSDYRVPKDFTLTVNLEDQTTSTTVKMNYSPWYDYDHSNPTIYSLGSLLRTKIDRYAGTPITVRLVLSGPAPEGGAQISLQNSRPDVVQQPISIMIPEDQRAIDFQVQIRAVATKQVATITASYAGESRAIHLQIRPPQVDWLTFDPHSVIAGASVTGTVRLGSPAPTDGVTVTLTNSDPNNGSIPSSVVVPAGKLTADFPITTFATDQVGVSVSRSMQIEAQIGSGNAVRRILQVKLQPEITTLTLNIQEVEPGSSLLGEVQISAIAPAEGTLVSITSSTPFVTVPSSITIASGKRIATFSVSTQAVTEITPFVIQTTSHEANKRFNFSLSPLLSTINLSSSSFIGFGTRLEGGQSIPAGVYLRREQPTATTVQLNSHSAKVTLPNTVTIPAGEQWGYFTVSTQAVVDDHTAEISATLQGVTKTVNFTLVSTESAIPAVVSELTWSDEQFSGARESSFIGHVTLNKAAISNMVIDITHDGGENVTAPSDILIRQGESEVTFEVAAIATEQTQVVTFSASHRQSEESIDAVHYTPQMRWKLKNITLPLEPIVPIEGSLQLSQGTIFLTHRMGRGESTVVTLTSSNPAVLPVPASVTISAGDRFKFKLEPAPVTEAQNITITATLDGITKSATVLVAPEGMLLLKILSLPNNKPLHTNRGYLGTIELNRRVPEATQAVITLTSSHPDIIAVPESIVVEANSSSGHFNFTSMAVSELQTVTITTTLNGISISEAVEVMPAHNPE
ncbi:MAG: hypothetical protein L3J28_03560 [Candidatus Polarisedimenticolaceae bacterium]|nr:hypothetical protein [Candidatus Polarisedimenticolaceae bacterium]